MTRRWSRAVPSVLLVLWAGPALGQVDEGREALAAAEFRRAIHAFDEAERGPLSREAYVSLLEGRALACWASGDETRARSDLAALAEIDPGHVFPTEVPPDVTDLFAEALAARAGPLSASAAFAAEGDRFTVTVQNDDAALVVRVRAHVRSEGEPWSVAEADPPVATFPVARAPGAGAQGWAELVGAGGAVLSTAGSEAAPVSWERTARAAPASPAEHPVTGDLRPREDPEESSTTLWVGLGVGAGALVIAATVALWVALSGGRVDGAQPGAPMVMGF